MQIQTIRKAFETFKSKFEPYKRVSRTSNTSRIIRKAFKALESKFEPFKRDLKHSNPISNHSKGIWSIWMQILTTRKGFEALERKFVTIWKVFEAF